MMQKAGRYLLRVFDLANARMTSHHCDGTYDDLLSLQNAFVNAMGDERVARISCIDCENAGEDRDDDIARLDWLQEEIRRRPTGLALEYRDGMHEHSGYRIVTNTRIGKVFPDLRTAIDFWRTPQWLGI